jgi:hypothetical protein
VKKKRILKDPETGEIVGATRTPFSHKAKELNKQIFAEKFEKNRLKKEGVPKQGNLGKNVIFLTVFFFLISFSIWIWLSEGKGSTVDDDSNPPPLKPSSGLEPKTALAKKRVVAPDPEASEKEPSFTEQSLLNEKLEEVESRLKNLRNLEDELKKKLADDPRKPETDAPVIRSAEPAVAKSFPIEINVSSYPKGQIKSKTVQFSETGPFERWDYFENNFVKKYCKSSTLKGLVKGPFEDHSYGNYENGRKRFSRYFAGGRANGLDESWFEDGKREHEGHRKNDLKDGKWSHWWSNGNQSDENYWKMGVPNGIWKAWFKDSAIKEQVRYGPRGELIALQAWQDGYVKELYFDMSVFDKKRNSVFSDWYRKEMKKNPTPPFQGFSIIKSGGYHVKALHSDGSLVSVRKSFKNKDLLEIELRQIFDYHRRQPNVTFQDEKWLLYIGG